MTRSEPTWRRIDFANDADASRAATFLATCPDRHLFHTADWLLRGGGRSERGPRVWLLEDGDTVRGYAPFMVQPWTLRFQLGEITYARRPLHRLALLGGPQYAADADPAWRRDATRALLAQVRAELQPREVLYLEGLRADRRDEVDGAGFHVVPYGETFSHHTIDLPDTLDDYLKLLSKRTREGLRRQRRKLRKFADDDVTLEPITREEQIDAFVAAAVEVSKRTYQWRLLGLGIRDPERLAETMRALAGLGWTRCFLLRVRGEAVAFMLGYVYEDTYYYIDVGFDPDWTKQSVGSVLHLDVLDALIGEGARAFDFSTGTGDHKSRFGTLARDEVNLVLIPRGLRGTLLTSTYVTSSATTRGLLAILDRLRVKDALKRWARRKAAPTS